MSYYKKIKDNDKVHGYAIEKGFDYIIPFGDYLKEFIASRGLDMGSVGFTLYMNKAQLNFIELQKRKTVWWVKSYLPKDTCKAIIEEIIQPKHYALCEHDKDIDENGKPIKTHTHILIEYSVNQYPSMLISLLRTLDICDGKPHLSNNINYLTHNSEKCRLQKKYQYAISDISSDDWSYWENKIDEKPVDFTNDIIEDMLGEMSTYDLQKKYGRAFIYHIRDYDIVVSRIMHERHIYEQRQKGCITKITRIDEKTIRLDYTNGDSVFQKINDTTRCYGL